MEGAGVVVGDQKSASIGVCASITANIGAALTAAKAKIAMQTMTTTVRREVTSVFYSAEPGNRNGQALGAAKRVAYLLLAATVQ